MILQEIIDRHLYQFIDMPVASWEEAIRISCKPLQNQKIVDQGFPDRLIESVQNYGPYIVILPNLAIPHTTQNAEGVFDTAIALTRFSEPIVFDPEDETKNAQFFFTLAAENETKHLENMASLFQILSEGDTLAWVMAIQNEKDLYACVDRMTSLTEGEEESL